MQIWAVVWLPDLRVVWSSKHKAVCRHYIEHEIGRDYDEDYAIMNEDEFVDAVRRSGVARSFTGASNAESKSNEGVTET